MQRSERRFRMLGEGFGFIGRNLRWEPTDGPPISYPIESASEELRPEARETEIIRLEQRLIRLKGEVKELERRIAKLKGLE